MQAVDILDEGARKEVEHFVEVLGGRAVGVIPRSEPTPGMVPWDEGHRRAVEELFSGGGGAFHHAAVETKEERKAWLARGRKLQHGWAVLARLMKKNRRAAMALRARFPKDETPLLLQLAEQGMRGVKEAAAVALDRVNTTPSS
jgi:hypothetical protein